MNRLFTRTNHQNKIDTTVQQAGVARTPLHRFIVTANRHLLLRGALLFILFALLFAALQFATPNLFGNDGYFHIKFAQIMRQQGLRPPFPWLPLTILNAENFYDHHFLYHVLLIPFTFGDLRLGAKWAGVISPALAFVAGWVVLRRQKVPYAALWALGFFAVSQAFLFRLSMTRVQAMSLLMLLLILHVTLTGRYRWLFSLSFIYIWLYDAFVLVLIVVSAYIVVSWLFERRLKWAPLGYALLGLALGLLINPYFPNNFIFIYHHILPKLVNTTAINVGNEWYPYSTWNLVENSGPALLAFIAGAFALGLREQRMEPRTAALFLISVIFGLMVFKSRRFIEYFPAFALIFCALAWSPLLDKWLANNKRLKRWLPLGMVLVLMAAIAFNLRKNWQEVRDSTSYQQYQQAAAWLQQNTSAGSLIFVTDWDDFTRLYFYNTHNAYTLGLDPTYMQSYNADLYELWRNISQGREEPPSPAITQNFGTDYVLTDLDHVRFLYVAAADPNMEEVYRDEEAVIFRILNSAP